MKKPRKRKTRRWQPSANSISAEDLAAESRVLFYVLVLWIVTSICMSIGLIYQSGQINYKREKISRLEAQSFTADKNDRVEQLKNYFQEQAIQKEGGASRKKNSAAKNFSE